MIWGTGVMIAAYACGPISGAHINPAITIALAAWKLFPWGRVLPYVTAQLLGAFVASLGLFMFYQGELARKENEKGIIRGKPGCELTAMCYCEFFPNFAPLMAAEGRYTPQKREFHDLRLSETMACIAEVLATMVLALAVVAATDDKNPICPKTLAPLVVGLTIAALIGIIGPLTQACLNPARDFGPRLFAFMAGWGEFALPGPNKTGWFTVYIFSPIAGAIIGVGLYRWVLRPAWAEPPSGSG
jgi:glycerol uptake facilitator protein